MWKVRNHTFSHFIRFYFGKKFVLALIEFLIDLVFVSSKSEMFPLNGLILVGILG